MREKIAFYLTTLFIQLCATSFLAAELWLNEHKIIASDAGASDQFGYSVSVDGKFAIVGALYDDDNGNNSGSAYIFKFDHASGQWKELQKLIPADPGKKDNFGWSVAIHDKVAVIGAPFNDGPSNSGSAYVFAYDSFTHTWQQKQKLTASDAASGDQFGKAVAIHKNRIIVGAPLDDDAGNKSGSAYIFTYSHYFDQWREKQKLTASDAASGDQFGKAVALHGKRAVIGARYHDNPSDSGSAYLFEYSRHAKLWEEKQKILPADPGKKDNFGWSVAIHDKVAVIGAPFNDNPKNSGSAYIFAYDSFTHTWQQKQKLTASDAAKFDKFGYALSLFGKRLLVGAPFNDNPKNSGSAYIFAYNRHLNRWDEKKILTASDAGKNDNFGWSVAIGKSGAIIGAPKNDDPNDSGSAYLYEIK